MMEGLMDADLRPLTRVLKRLGFTSPLGAEDDRYVPRRDKLGERLRNRLLAPTARMLLLAGPAGCGKSTELLHIQASLQPDYAVFLCPCDRDLDLYRLDEVALYRYVLWRVLFLCKNNLAPALSLTPEIVTEALRRVGTDEVRIERPSIFFATEPPEHERNLGALTDTLHRLFSEIERGLKRVLLLIDGLEKAPPEASKVLSAFARSPMLADCQTVMVIPSWALHGFESPRQWQEVDVLDVSMHSGVEFVREVLTRRVGSVFEQAAVDRIADKSGGAVRDGLQLASLAARSALDEDQPRVLTRHVDEAVDEMRSTYKQIFSDDLPRARQFLKHVMTTGELPPDPDWRTRMLATSAVLPSEKGRFFVHPLISDL